ncbi:hypothetical protein DIPPA_22275 [Diplonema papillatum]|nr:hypothetical protein DIPPA_22275 [Diplonema papillatum]
MKGNPSTRNGGPPPPVTTHVRMPLLTKDVVTVAAQPASLSSISTSASCSRARGTGHEVPQFRFERGRRVLTSSRPHARQHPRASRPQQKTSSTKNDTAPGLAALLQQRQRGLPRHVRI